MERQMNSKPASKGPLEGMKVIELAHIMAGPVCGMMMADMGADVIKVEKPDGDDSRRFLPPDINGESAAYLMMNRNKRGIALNLKDPDAIDVLRSCWQALTWLSRTTAMTRWTVSGWAMRHCARATRSWFTAPYPGLGAPDPTRNAVALI